VPRRRRKQGESRHPGVIVVAPVTPEHDWADLGGERSRRRFEAIATELGERYREILPRKRFAVDVTGTGVHVTVLPPSKSAGSTLIAPGWFVPTLPLPSGLRLQMFLDDDARHLQEFVRRVVKDWPAADAQPHVVLTEDEIRVCGMEPTTRPPRRSGGGHLIARCLNADSASAVIAPPDGSVISWTDIELSSVSPMIGQRTSSPLGSRRRRGPPSSQSANALRTILAMECRSHSPKMNGPRPGLRLAGPEGGYRERLNLVGARFSDKQRPVVGHAERLWIWRGSDRAEQSRLSLERRQRVDDAQSPAGGVRLTFAGVRDDELMACIDE
jgi:hypothetical protein